MTQTASKIAGLVTLCWTLSGAGALALTEGDHPSPHNQIYQVQFGNAAPVFGGTIYFAFGDGLIDSYTETGIGGADQPGGTGDWDSLGDGRIRIEGMPVESDPGDELPPAPELQLLESGQTEVICESWPVVESLSPKSFLIRRSAVPSLFGFNLSAKSICNARDIVAIATLAPVVFS